MLRIPGISESAADTQSVTQSRFSTYCNVEPAGGNRHRKRTWAAACPGAAGSFPSARAGSPRRAHPAGPSRNTPAQARVGDGAKHRKARRSRLNFLEEKGIVEVGGGGGCDSVLQRPGHARNHPHALTGLQLWVYKLLVELLHPSGLEGSVAYVSARGESASAGCDVASSRGARVDGDEVEGGGNGGPVAVERRGGVVRQGALGERGWRGRGRARHRAGGA